MQDSGEGTLDLNDMMIALTMFLIQNDCKYHAQIGVNYVQMMINKFKLNLQSKYAFLYDSIMGLLT